jgi:hypothetical protein
MAAGTLGIVPQLLAIEAKPRRFALAECGRKLAISKRRTGSQPSAAVQISTFLVIANIHGRIGMLSGFRPSKMPVGGSEKWGHFGRIVALLSLAATTSGISPRSEPDDSLLYVLAA